MQSETDVLDPDMEFELSFSGHRLIPGLPDDVALLCLLKVPVDNHGACWAVCKRCFSLLGNKEQFFTWRKVLGVLPLHTGVFSFFPVVWSLM